MTNRVLFICTGNYYRSRFAEAIFNDTAQKRGLDWRAFSRGLAIHWAEGYLSPFTADALQSRRINLDHTGKGRVQLTVHDLENSTVQVALDRQEHRPMMQQQFPEWADRIEYWSVPDVPETEPDVALAAIEEHVKQLLQDLS